MVRPIVHHRFEINQWVPRNDAICCRFLNTLVDWLDVLIRNRRTFNFTFKLVPRATLEWFHANETVTVLTAATRLANKFSFTVGFLSDGLSVGNLRLTNICLNTEFTL